MMIWLVPPSALFVSAGRLYFLCLSHSSPFLQKKANSHSRSASLVTGKLRRWYQRPFLFIFAIGLLLPWRHYGASLVVIPYQFLLELLAIESFLFFI